jgi:capsular exopolysaccharide synthesis family protein
MARKRTADAQALQNAVKTLAANIRFASVDDPVRTICVASAIPSEGKTTTSVALGRAFAEGGSRVLLLEADMRRRSLATALGRHGRYGLYSVLAGEHSVQEAAIPVGTSKRLFFLDAEPGIPNPADVLQSKRFHALLTQLSSQFDYVIVDTPPVTTFVDAAVAASVTDATILVVRQDYTHRDDVAAAYEQLVQAGANVIGTVLNCCDAATSGHYYGYYKERRNDSYDVVAPSADVAQPLGAAPASAPVEPARPASNRVSSPVSGARSPRPIQAGGVATRVKPVNSSVRSQRAAGQNGLDQTSAFLKQAGYAPRIPHEEE